MAHLNTELLIDYWRRRRGERAMPARSDIDPADFAALLPHAFIAARSDDGDIRFRLAGEAVIDLHARPLAGESLLALWTAPHRQPLTKALGASLDLAEALVVTAEAPSDDAPLFSLEVAFAPLTGPDGRADRFLGLYQPISKRTRHSARELRMLAINGSAAVRGGPHLRLAVLDGRRLA
jgi:hypothetical protein